jgi:hypothetical protein
MSARHVRVMLEGAPPKPVHFTGTSTGADSKSGCRAMRLARRSAVIGQDAKAFREAAPKRAPISKVQACQLTAKAGGKEEPAESGLNKTRLAVARRLGDFLLDSAHFQMENAR